MSKQCFPYLENGKVFLSELQTKKINATPSNECWICDCLSGKTVFNLNQTTGEVTYYLEHDYLLENIGFIEHLEQITGKIKLKREKVIFS